MKTTVIHVSMSVLVTLSATFAFAHNGAQHAVKSEAPNCKSVKAMDHSTIDMNDPVMQALMKKCGEAPVDAPTATTATNNSAAKSSAAASAAVHGTHSH